MIDSISALLSIALILGGLVSIVFPIAPSIPTIWFGIFVYGIAHNYVDVDQNFLMIVTLIAFATIFLDYMLSKGGVQKFTAGPWGILGAIIGGAAGTFFGPFGTYLAGPILGAVIAETLRGRDRVYSYQSGNYTIVAFMGGTLIKLVAALAMIGLFVLRLQHKV
jgi:uncharacterized protein YqgC (DUF456 family)